MNNEHHRTAIAIGVLFAMIDRIMRLLRSFLPLLILIPVLSGTTDTAWAQENQENGSCLDCSVQEDRPAPVKKIRRKSPKHFFALSLFGNLHIDSFMDHSGDYGDYTNLFGGITGSLRFGFLKHDNSWEIEQQFGHVWGLKIESGSKNMTRFDAATFIGLNQDFTGQAKLKAQFNFGFGFLYNMPHRGKTAPYGEKLAINKHGTNLAVSMKLGITGFWYPVRTMAFGFSFNYILGYDFGSWLRAQFAAEFSEEEQRDSMLVQIIQPGIVWMVEF